MSAALAALAALYGASALAVAIGGAIAVRHAHKGGPDRSTLDRRDGI